MSRGPKQKLQGCHQTTVNLEDRHIDYINRHKFEKSELFRQYIDSCIMNESSQEDKLKLEIEKEELEIQDKINQVEQKKILLEKLVSERTGKEKEIMEIEELENQRIELFGSKYKKLIHGKTICEVDYYRNVKREFKFEDPYVARDWLFEHYSLVEWRGSKYSSDVIKTFLRYGKDLEQYW